MEKELEEMKPMKWAILAVDFPNMAGNAALLREMQQRARVVDTISFSISGSLYNYTIGDRQ